MAIRLGTRQDDELTGTTSADQLFGLAGDDTLSGGSGRDLLFGGAGNDTYIIDNKDLIFEIARGGTDTVVADFSYVLARNFENLTLAGIADINGTGNAADNVILGNAGSNTLIGGAGNDTLDGGLSGDVFGIDVLLGGAGDDVLIYDSDDVNGSSGLEVVLDGGTGTDTLRLIKPGDGINFLSTPFEAIKNFEVIDLAGDGNALLLSANSVKLITSTGVLQIEGDADDRAAAQDHFWTFGGYVTIGEQTYAEYLKAGVTVRVDLNIDQQSFPDAFAQPVSVIELSNLNGTDGFRLDGIDEADFLGLAVATAGDVNGDGLGDLILGAGLADPIQNEQTGETYVVFGAAAGFPAVMGLATLDGTNGFRLPGIDNGDISGFSVASAGDVNGDGFADLIIGAPGAGGAIFTESHLAGESYVVFGTASGFGANVDLGALDGTNGFRLDGARAVDRSGASVAAAGDVNGDGYGDLIIGAWAADPDGITDAGASYVVFGQASGFGASLDLDSLDGANGFRLDGIAASDQSGEVVASAGDLNGDGFDDVVIGASLADDAAGAAYVVFGKASGFAPSLDLAGLDGTNGFRLEGVNAVDLTGHSVAAAGDVNGDGIGDLIIGALGADPDGVGDAGASYVIFGNTAGFAPVMGLANLDGTNGFRLDGVAGDRSGRSVAAAGDVNGDGFDDFIIGAADGATSYVVYGKASGFGPTLGLSALDGTDGFRLTEPGSGDVVSSAGDINGDGFADLAIGASGVGVAGATYVVFGGNFSHEATHLGGSEANTLSGSGSADVMVSGEGNDTLSGGGGADVFRAGAGDDLIRIADASFFDIDAGSGIDTLALEGSGLVMDLTALANTKLSGIETIDLTGTGDSALVLAAGDLLDLSDTTNQLTVNGDSGDAVNLTGSWDDGGVASGYHAYSSGAATLLVDADVLVSFV